MNSNMTYLWINNSGASTAEIERGVAAAQYAFSITGFSADECHAAAQRIADGEDDDDDHILQTNWNYAEEQAFKAAFAGWTRWPEGAVLVLEGAV